MKTGLVLEGGAMRGMYTAGILDVMLEHDISADAAVGVSAGAVFGCNYKSKQIGRTIRYNSTYCRDPRYAGFGSLLRTGDYFNEQFCYHEIPETLDPFDRKTFAENPMPFYVVTTDVHTGKPLYHLCETGDAEDLQWMRASASMPFVSNVVRVGGYEMLDGGISDSIPLSFLQNAGYHRCIVILTRPRGYRKEKSSALPLMRRMLHKYPALAEALAHRHEMYNAELDRVMQAEKAGEILLLCPEDTLGVHRTEKDPQKLKMLYKAGRQDAEKQLSAIRSFLRAAEDL